MDCSSAKKDLEFVPFEVEKACEMMKKQIQANSTPINYC